MLILDMEMLKLDRVLLMHGSGGVESNKLIRELFFDSFKNDILEKCEDSAILGSFDNLAFTTDSYTVKPLFFSGGDIGKLAICGTCNDLAMVCAKPKFLSCAFVIEEGFLIEDLRKIVKSMSEEANNANIKIVTGDTKVVPKGNIDGLFINTSGVGEIEKVGVSQNYINEDLSIIVSGTVGDHGAVIFANREGIELISDLKSDCKLLYFGVSKLIQNNIEIIALRDATRGGLSAVLNEWSNASGIGIEVFEDSIPIRDEVKGICEILGFEAYNLANEGMFVVATSKKDETKAIEILKNAGFSNSSIIGYTTKKHNRVVINSPWSSRRVLEYPSGELLPRIC